MPVTYVDICWTLFSSNTTYDFCRWVKRGDGAVDLPRPGFLKRKFNVLLYRLTGVDYLRRSFLSVLKGLTRAEIEELARRFCAEYLAGRRIEAVWKALPQGEKALLSSTLDVIAAAVAAEFGFSRYYGSRLALDEHGVCLGYIDNDLQGHKIEQIKLLDGYSIFTDNLSDLPLVAAACSATIVVYGNRRRWDVALKDAGVDTSKISFVYAETARY